MTPATHPNRHAASGGTQTTAIRSAHLRRYLIAVALPFAALFSAATRATLARPVSTLSAPTVQPKGQSYTMTGPSGGWGFQVFNNNVGTATDTLTVQCTGAVVSCAVSPAKMNVTGPGAPAIATVTFTGNGSGLPGTVVLRATDKATGLWDEGSLNVTTANKLVVDVSPHNGANRDVALCLADCFETVYTYSTPSYVSMDVPRSLGLVYRSGRVWPVGTVNVDVRDTTAKTVSKLSIQLKTAAGALVTQFGARQEVFYSYQPGVNNRLEAQFDASGLTTGSYSYTALITAYYTDNTTQTGNVAVKVLVDNAATSPYGSGWAVGGLQRLYAQSDGGVVITEGEGSIRYYAGPCATAPCSFQQTPGDFSVVSRHSWADGTTYDRRYPDGTVVAFNSNGLAAYTKDRFGNATNYGYDASNRLVSVTDPVGQATTLTYAGPSSSLSRITDPSGRISLINQPTGTRITSIQDPAGGLSFNSAAYDTHGRLTGWSDRRGGAWNATYDCMRRADSTFMPTVTVMVGGSTQSVRPVTRRAAADRQVGLCETSSLGSSTNPLPSAPSANVRASTTSAKGYVTRYAVDAFLAPTRIEEPASRVTVVTRNTNSQVTSVRSPNGHVVTSTWSGPDLVETYDSVTQARTTLQYEQTYHQVTSRATGASRDSSYWSGGKLDSTEIAVPNAHRTHYTYEALGGRLTGRIATITDPLGHITTWTYGASGMRNLLTITSAGRSTTYTYDGIGRLVLIVGPNADTTRASFDSLNRTTRVIGVLRDTTTLSYDALFPVSMRDAKGQVYSVSPNALGWIESQTDPGSRTESFAYDSGGNVIQHVNRRGQYTTYAYDSLGNIARQVAGSDTTEFATDPLGAFVASKNAESVDSTIIDKAGRPVVEISVRNGQRIDRVSGFNAHGLRDSLRVLQWPSTQRYHYSSSLVLDTLIDDSGAKTTLGTNDDGLLSTVQLPTSTPLSITREFPGTHTPSQITYSDASINALIGRVYTYGSNGLVDRRLDAIPTGNESGRAFAYDLAGRVTQYFDYSSTNDQYICTPGSTYAWDPVTGQSCWSAGDVTYAAISNYQYDLVGNRSDSGAVVMAGNRLVRFRGDTMTYDADGNLTSRRALGGGRVDSLTWNAGGQLTSLTHNGVTTSFGYDGFGRRVRKTSATGTTRYLYDGDNLLAELDGSGARIAQYTYLPGIDHPHSVRRWSGGTSTKYYYATDYPGNVVALLDSNAAVVNRYGYAPFGTRQDSVGTVPNSLRFGAREFDTETGLYYNRARYYDPTLGRFISEDPLGLAAGVNQYAYANNNPPNAIDPSGLVTITCPKGWEAEVEVSPDGSESLTCTPSKSGGGATGNLVDLLLEMNVPGSWFGGLTGWGSCANFTAELCGRVRTAINRLLKTPDETGVCQSYGIAAQARMKAGRIRMIYTELLSDEGRPLLGNLRRDRQTVYLFPLAFRRDSRLYMTLAHEEWHSAHPGVVDETSPELAALDCALLRTW